MSRNQLDQETSPYLLQHRANPVHWRPWGPAALAAAEAEGKPIMLSVGYAACHWCHVMAHESFEDAETAKLINELFIPVKVDREERPDIDIIYQTALAMLGQQGGWPLTMFLTPSGEPFWGGTYFPPAPRYGRPSFRQVLAGVADTYHREPRKVAENGTALKRALLQQASPADGEPPGPDRLNAWARTLLAAIDTAHGGLAGAPKFPQVPVLAFLWRAALRNADEALREAVTLSLDHMSHGGIYDHLGGGYARYSTDERWLVPHFEKMLYDNAELLDLLTLVWKETRTPLYAQRVAETIGWLAREMMAEHRAFAATLDADSGGKEGKYYIWREEEIDRLLPPDLAEPFKQAYDVRENGNWEGATILHRNIPQPRAGAEFERQLSEARAILLRHRSTRVPPGRDDKVLADWNGMMIAALANAAFTFERPDWLALAETAFAAIRQHLSDGDRLFHSLRLGRHQGAAILDDYAQMSRAALLLHEVTGRTDYLQQAIAWVGMVDAHYWDAEGGAYFFTADDAPDLIVRTKTATDTATPAGNAVMVEVLGRLFCQTGDDRYRQRAEDIVKAFAGELDRGYFVMASLLNGWDFLNNAVQVALVGPIDDPRRQALLRIVAESPEPNRVLMAPTPAQPLPPAYPAAAKVAGGTEPEAPRALVCRGSVCTPPMFHPEALRAALATH